MDDFAKVDNILAMSQTDIGESSNLAQIAQTYDCTFNDEKYADYVCILSVVAQIAIDNSKRKFDIDVTSEIKRIKEDMNITENKYPEFWKMIKHGFNRKNINKELHCPMNALCDIEIIKFRNPYSTLPMSHFFIKHKLEKDRKQCKKVEELIEKYSLEVFLYNTQVTNDYLLLRSDFNELVNDIKKVYISSTYTGLISWLIDRAFVISPSVNSNSNILKTTINTNKSLLLKVLYEINPKCFFECFSKSAVFDPTE